MVVLYQRARPDALRLPSKPTSSVGTPEIPARPSGHLVADAVAGSDIPWRKARRKSLILRASWHVLTSGDAPGYEFESRWGYNHMNRANARFLHISGGVAGHRHGTSSAKNPFGERDRSRAFAPVCSRPIFIRSSPNLREIARRVSRAIYPCRACETFPWGNSRPDADRSTAGRARRGTRSFQR